MIKVFICFSDLRAEENPILDRAATVAEAAENCEYYAAQVSIGQAYFHWSHLDSFWEEVVPGWNSVQ